MRYCIRYADSTSIYLNASDKPSRSITWFESYELCKRIIQSRTSGFGRSIAAPFIEKWVIISEDEFMVYGVIDS